MLPSRDSIPARFAFPIPSRPLQYKLAITGNGSTSFVHADEMIWLQEAGEETLIEYSGKAQVGGLIAGVGQRVVEGVAKYLVIQFFQSLDSALASSEPRQ